MDRMRMESVDMTAQNIDKIGSIFPNCITETVDENGKPKKAINFELLKQMLADEVIDGDEAYEFTWVGKKAAIVEAHKPIRKTLRPCKAESKEWDKTENLYIEGDNLEVLKLLQESYLNKVKMIYIDPPYNTGNDFIYNDDFKMSADEYIDEVGEIDEDGNRMFKNTDSNGRFHSDWCSMMYSRLMLARNLLSKDGVIFISIDDNEVDNLREICNEIFGLRNYVGTVIWERAFAPKNDAKYFSASHDFVLVYAKSLTNFSIGKLPRSEEANARYKNPDNDPRGPWAADNMTVKTYSVSYDYQITTPNGTVISPTNGRCWFTSRERMQNLIEDGRVYFGADGGNTPRLKRYLVDVQQGMTPTTIWKYDDVGHNQEGRQELKKLFDDKGYFDGPKPQRLLQRILTVANLKDDSIIFDFFSGSASTAQAVMQLNAEDGGNRKFIMVQLPEKTDEKSEAYKAGYKNICEIGKERIRRAGDKIKAETGADIDYGFRVLKLDDSNMTDVYYSADEYDQNMLSKLESNVKEDRSDIDLLFGCLLEWGLPLSMPYKSEQIEGCTVHTYNDGDLIACFDKNVPDNVIKTVAKRKPLRAVFRDNSFANSPAKINVTEIFKLLAPDTRVKVI
ncbi:site-specific DNA-methyltransferase [Phascolarctobacterium faecium]|uniref:site-specific DNA-methyltransferase n=1 Tax=Phascolarctobacterium faecium TaxID=33025 RepID=UPI003521A4F7